MRGANGSRMEKHFHAVGNRFHSGNDFTVEKRPLLGQIQKYPHFLHMIIIMLSSEERPSSPEEILFFPRLQSEKWDD